MSGLQTEIKEPLRLFTLQTLLQAYAMAKLQEMTNELKVLDELCEKNVEGMGMKSKEVELDDNSPEDADMGGNEFVDGANGSEGNVEVVMDTVGNATGKGNESLCLEGVEWVVPGKEEDTNDGGVKDEELELNPLSEGDNNSIILVW